MQLIDKIRAQLPREIKVVEQGKIVANSLKAYLERHPEMEKRLSKSTSNDSILFYTTGGAESFAEKATSFWGDEVVAIKTILRV